MSAESKAFDLQHQVRNNAQDLQDYLRELDSWEQDSKKKDKSISSSKSILKPTIPPVRSSTGNVSNQQQQQNQKGDKKSSKKRKKKGERIGSYDYRAWDKLDVESAMNEMSSSESDSAPESLDSDSAGVRDDDSQEERAEKRAEAERQMGNEHFKACKYTQAIEHYSRSLQLKPDCESSLTNRAMALIRTEKYAAAEQDCSTALSANSRNVKALYRRGLARYNLGNYEIAKGDFDSVLKIDPENQNARDYLHKLNVKINPELEGQFKAVSKPPHLMSKKPLVKVEIEEIGSGSATESEGEQTVKKDKTQIMTEIFETSEISCSNDLPKIEVEPNQVSPKQLPKLSPPKPKIPNSLPSNSTEFINVWRSLKQEPELFFKYFQSIPLSLYPKLLIQFLENEGLPFILRVLTDFYLQNELTYFEELISLTKVSRFNVAVMFLSKDDKFICERLFRNLELSSFKNADLTSIAKLYDISLN